MELIGIYLIACGLLMLAGGAKAARPDDTARALVILVPNRFARVASFSQARQAVRVGALVEAALGAFALVFPQPVTASLVAISYLLFVCVAAYAWKLGESLSTCGCFGRPDTPATGLHVFLNLVFLVAAVAVALRPPHPTELTSLLQHQPWSGIPLLLAAGVGTWLAYLALSALSSLEAARRLVGQSYRKAASNT
jgi:hypothetical protein